MPDVLLIDDDPALHDMVAFALSDAGLDLQHAATGVDALEQIERHPPACIVIDVALPDLDGFEVLTLMRARDLAPDAKVLVVSGRDDEPALVRAWELGAVGYVVKPTDPDALVIRIKALVAAEAPAA